MNTCTVCGCSIPASKHDRVYALYGGVFNYDRLTCVLVINCTSKNVRSVQTGFFMRSLGGGGYESIQHTNEKRHRYDETDKGGFWFPPPVVIRYLITMNYKMKKPAIDTIMARVIAIKHTNIIERLRTTFGLFTEPIFARIMREFKRTTPYICFPVDSFCIVIGIVCLIRKTIHFGFAQFNCAGDVARPTPNGERPTAMTPKNKLRIVRLYAATSNKYGSNGMSAINRNRSDVKCQNGRIRRRVQASL